MLDVFLTADVEIWCDGWSDLDAKFPDAFRRYIHGPTKSGDFGLPYQVSVLRDHGLKGVFFVEPLFSTRFGIGPLAEIVGILNDADQEVQLHLHTEWVDEANSPVVPLTGLKRQFLHNFSLTDQRTLIRHGVELLSASGVASINAFRAGSFGLNGGTIEALKDIGIRFDASYNASQFGPTSGVLPGQILLDAVELDGVIEYPMTVFDDGTGKLRHTQLTACSFKEMEGLLWQAAERQYMGFVILFHNFELLSPSKKQCDPIVVGRYRALCAFLDRHRDVFNVHGFAGHRVQFNQGAEVPVPLKSPLWCTATRNVAQVYRRRYT